MENLNVMNHRILSSFFFTTFLLFKSDPVHAYLDPGSVSLVLQAIVAAIIGATLTWKHWFRANSKYFLL